ncbi:VRR-NUC domain-containing protein [Aliikangiella coralliicola]|uniref:phosphodiesterase I n=1 Tax=Aliikangiella coralliicola TaxID=2592383 RepID=A0A545UD19_9GAMM|nr:VRR-NUC domain-containing protein [Aliikangiella coralliicola]TQV87333.1 VRR-NUC domain-containing protein [Aliikangiella coralliicola]
MLECRRLIINIATNNGLMAIQLPQGYYLTNFVELIDFVFEQYQDLLSAQEQNFHHTFKSLSSVAQKLYVRMLTRKGDIFRCSKLNYQEIPDTTAAAEELANVQLIHIDPELQLSEVTPLFSKPELLKILTSFQFDKNLIAELKKLKRAELEATLLEFEQLEAEVAQLLVQQIEENFYEISQPQLFDSYKLLFFGNLNQDLTDFVLRDLGLYQFENYLIDKNSRLFNDRKEIDNYLSYYEKIQELDEIMSREKGAILNLHQQLPRSDKVDNILARRIERVNLALARQLERLEEWDDALQLYAKCQLPPARERTARILVKKEEIKPALTICEQIIDSPIDESELIFAKEFGYRTAKKHQVKWAKPEQYQPHAETISIGQGDECVELDVVDYFSSQGDCFYVENALFCGLFGLHFWDVIFAPVKGAFTHPFQSRPHDLYESDFLLNRKTPYEKAVSQLKDINQNIDEILALWRDKSTIVSPFIYTQSLDTPLIKKALTEIPNHHWQAVFQRLWSDLRANRSGFPDLIFFPEGGGYELIEVKGPGDRLQKNQIRWMQFFHQHHIPHRVIHVEWR